MVGTMAGKGTADHDAEVKVLVERVANDLEASWETIRVRVDYSDCRGYVVEQTSDGETPVVLASYFTRKEALRHRWRVMAKAAILSYKSGKIVNAAKNVEDKTA